MKSKNLATFTAVTAGSLVIYICIAVFNTAAISSCGFTAGDPVNTCIDSNLLKHESTNIIENVNNEIVTTDSLMIVHGHVIAKDKWTSGINVFLQYPVGRNFDKATVILNGWHLTFLEGSEEVQFIGAAVGNVKLESGILTWNAAGNLKNKNETHQIEGRFYYTIVLWNSIKINLITDEGNLKDLCSKSQSGGNSYYSRDNDEFNTALATKITSMKLSGFPTRGIKGILPRGFLFNNGLTLLGGSDHNLAQIAYRLGEVATTDEKTEPRRMVDSTYISWRSDFILKDDDDRQDFWFFETVSAIAGSDLGYIQPPYSILPSEYPGWFSGCVPNSSSAETKEYNIQNIPYRYAVPLLTGWDLEFFCGDEEVKSIGVYIEDWSYSVPQNNAFGGTLTYKLTTQVHDGSGDFYNYSTHHVSVIGIVDISKRLRQ